MEVYWILIALTVLLGAVLPQKGKHRSIYILLMALLLTLVSALRHNHMAGDLKKYHWEFLCSGQYGWIDPQLLQRGRNAGFYLLLKLVYFLTGGSFQLLLILIAAAVQFSLAALIWRFSPMPRMSYLIYLCMGFFSFGLVAIKQALAMAFVLLSFIGIADRRPGFFLFMVFLAALIHMPALCILPAYVLSRLRLNGRVLLGYGAVAVALYLLKDHFVALISTIYYQNTQTLIYSGGLGNRFWMLLILALLPLVLQGISQERLPLLFPFMALAVLAQMLSGFDNIFTRMADYYFQLSVLYIPLIFYGESLREHASPAGLLFLNRRSLRLAENCLCVFLIWFYHTYYLKAVGFEPYRFLWETPL